MKAMIIFLSLAGATWLGARIRWQRERKRGRSEVYFSNSLEAEHAFMGSLYIGLTCAIFQLFV